MTSELIPAGNAGKTNQIIDATGDDYWADIPEVDLDPQILEKNLLVSASRKNPAYMAFDILRTRLLQALKEHGWCNIGITSPTAGCGKTFVASNLALSLARRATSRTLLIDMDLRDPGLAKAFGIGGEHNMRDFLTGHINPEDYFLRIGANLAVALNTDPVSRSAEMMQETMTADVLQETQDLLIPNVTLYDLPPALTSDEVIAFLPQLDGVLLVVGGGTTTDDHIRDVERLLEDQIPLLGVVLNRAEDSKPF